MSDAAPLIDLGTLQTTLGSPTRWVLLRELADGSSLMVSELAQRTRISSGAISKQLAILIAESGLFNGWDVRVYGSDISRRCVAAARRGIYGASAFRAVGPEVKRSYFTDRADGLRPSSGEDLLVAAT